MGKKIRRKTMSQSQNNTNDQQQPSAAAEAPAQELNSEQRDSGGWLSENWKLLLGFVFGLVLLVFGLFAVVQSAANNAYNSGYKAGVEYTITTYENTPWYSRWWAGITGTFPGKK